MRLLCLNLFKKQNGIFAKRFPSVLPKEWFFSIAAIDKFSDLKNLNIGEETKIKVHSWKERSKISITSKFHGEIL